MKLKSLTRSRLLNLCGLLLIVLGIALLGITFLMQVEQIASRYAEILAMLDTLDEAIAAIPNKGLIVIAIMLMYLAKALIPIPISAVCVIAGMVFPTELAVAVNIAGFAVLVIIKFFWGKHLGRGFVYKSLSKYDNVRKILDSDTAAKDGLLVALRIVPIIPINTVSQLYGAMNFELYKYIFLSILGFLPRIISYSMVGRHVFNPFSFAFIVPLVIIFVISGVAIIGVNTFFDMVNSRNKTKE